MFKTHRTLTLLLMLLCFLPALGQAQTDNWATRTMAPATFPVLGGQTLAKPDTLIVEDYRGPDNAGDQGGFVLATFKNTYQHAQLSRYRLWRELAVQTSYDPATGKIRSLAEPRLTWVPWAVVDAVPAKKGWPPITRAVIPTIDKVSTRWAITAEIGVLNPVADTPASVKETLALLNIQSVMTEEEIKKDFSLSYEEAVLDNRQDLVLGRLDLDGLRSIALGISRGTLAQLTPFVRASDATIAATAVRAIDNIPPTGIGNLKATFDGRRVKLTWQASFDDRTVGFIPYHGWVTPMLGVWTYDVYRGASDETGMVKVASLASGSTFYMDAVDVKLGNHLIYRVDPTDQDNAMRGEFVTVELGGEQSPITPAVIEAMSKTLEKPKDFALQQNFPNPFNPATTIKYDLAEDGQVELHVYNVLGQTVRTLVNGPQAAGRYAAQWDSRDESGISVASGLYFYRLTAGRFTSVKKLMLLK